MGKPRKLKSCIRGALQEILNTMKPSAGAPLYIQPVKTRSFTDVLTRFNSVYYVPPAASCFSSDCETGSAAKVHGGEEEATSTCAATTSTSTCSSCLSSSNPGADASPVHVLAEEDFNLHIALRSERFFFSPYTSRSITGESFHPFEESEETEERDYSLEISVGTEIEKEMKRRSSPELCAESIPTAMASTDPFGDFRTSMEEMVTAYGLNDWTALQELLHCYLRLNDKKTHRFIILAFMDLLARRSDSLSSPPPFSPPTLPLHRCPPEKYSSSTHC